VTIREAGAADVPVITRLVNLAYRIEEFFVHGERTDDAEIRGMLATGAFLLLEEAGEVTGCVYVESGPPTGYLGMLAVDPGRQGGGRGRRLVAAVEERCRAAGCTALDLHVVDLRRELPAFYGSLGYAPYGRREWPEAVRDKLKQPAHFVLYRKTIA
jgi:N-acetylglutamate synthase-like GNAT family acetyltransferase